MQSIFGDLTENRPQADAKKRSDFATKTAVADPRTVPASEVPLKDYEPYEAELPTRSKGNGGAAGFSGRSLRTSALEAPEVGGTYERKSWGRGLVTLFLLVLLAGLVWYNYPSLVENYHYLSQLPASEALVKTLEERANSTQTQLRDLTANWGSLQSQLTKLDRSVSLRFVAARKHTEELIAEGQQRLEAELNQRTQAMNARLDRVEADQAETRSQVAQVAGELEKEAAQRQQLGQRQDSTDQGVAKLEQQAAESQSGLEALAHRVNRQRVDFEVFENKTAELAPGVSLTVLKTNVSYQNFDGFLSLTNEGRTVWLSSVGVSKAMSFYPSQSDRSYDLVVTKIGRKGVVGYLMIPEAAKQG